MNRPDGLRWIAALVSVFVTLLVLPPRDTYACSCSAPESVHEAYERATLVFEGRFINNEGDERDYALPHNFLVSRIWTGPFVSSVTVYTGRGGGDCGYPFEGGHSYLVYAHYVDPGEVFSTNICSRTRPIESAGEDVAALGAGRVPPPAALNPTALSPIRSNVPGILWYILSGVATGAGLHLVAQRRRG